MGVRRVTVVGSGIVGMATALALRERGVDVVSLEAGEPGGGQSKGPVRIFRMAHASRPLTELAKRARDGWTAWEGPVGRELIGDQGAVIVGDRVEPMRRNLELAGLAGNVLDPSEVRARAGVAAAPGEAALLDSAGGNICAGAIMSYLAAATEDQRTITRLEIVERRADGLDLLTSDGIWSTDHLVICAAEGTPALARQLGLDLKATFYRHSRFAFPLRDPARRPACLIDHGGAEHVYGLVVGSSGRYAVGLSGDTDYPADRVSADEASHLSHLRLRAHVAERMPELEPEPVAELRCTFQRTPLLAGGDDVGVWALPGATVCFGNNLFKFAPLLGEMLADTALSGVVPESLRVPA
ncbi:MAG: NAD(P)/FAD-dependent oxidoreductase [Solirubrobacteraceae bacterium]